MYILPQTITIVLLLQLLLLLIYYYSQYFYQYYSCNKFYNSDYCIINATTNNTPLLHVTVYYYEYSVCPKCAREGEGGDGNGDGDGDDEHPRLVVN